MNSFSNTGIIVTATAQRLATAVADVLTRAGADVHVCTPRRDLWSTLADRVFDAIVVVVDPSDMTRLSDFASLREDPRARSIPYLLLLPAGASLTAASAAGLGTVSLLPLESDAESLVCAVQDLIAPRRLRLALEVECRELSAALDAESARADTLATELANFSHDLRAMLGVAFGFACNLRDGVVAAHSDAERLHTRRIVDALGEAAELLDALQESRVRLGTRAPRRVSSLRTERRQRSHVHLGRLVEEVLSLLDQKAAARGVRLAGELDDTVRVWADPLKLKQVVVNLVDNAIKYGARGGQVLVRVEWSRPSGSTGKQSRRLAQIGVSDSGPGIPQDLRERVFERGFRGEETEPGTGQGIGLNLVREIVVQHGGSIQYEEGSGASFRVLLPPDLRERERPDSKNESEEAP